MQYLQGNDRDQMLMLSLEEAVATDAFAIVVDVFADAIDFWCDLRNLLFLLPQTTTGMSAAISYHE